MLVQGPAFDQAVESEAGEVVAHLVDGVGDAEQLTHLGAEAPIGETEGIQTDAEGAEQGHDEDLRTVVRATSGHPR